MSTKETMTIHKALAELKVLDSRIGDAIGSGAFITTKKNNQEKVRGKSVDEFKTDAKASYDKVIDLIRRRNAIKDAVNVSNANTKVKIGGVEYTVVEAIDKKNHGMEFYATLRNVLAHQLAARKAELDKHNSVLTDKAEQFVKGMNSGEAVKKDSEEYMTTLNAYIKSNTMELIDPLDLEKKIAELDDMMNAFLPEVDAALSVSNALTTIEIEY